MFVRIYNVANLAKTNTIQEYKELIAYSYLCEKTVEKLKSLHIFDEETTGNNNSKTGFGTFISTDIAEDLIDTIRELEIDKQILRHRK